MKICDIHTHSNNSFDACDSVDKMCKSAVQKGLYAIAITDHCEAPMIPLGEDCEYGCFDKLIPNSYHETMLARQKYAGKLKVLSGIELGEPMHDSICTQKALNYASFDFVIASVHNLRDMEDFYYLDFNKVDTKAILNRYFDELCETAQFKNFDTLAHLTYPLRYIKRDTGKVPDLSEYQDKIDSIYKILIKNNKALEVNVSGFSKGLETSLPDIKQIKRYRALGGEYITLGSDSHNADDVGRNIEKGIDAVQKAGFDRYVIYENRCPVFIEIN